MKNRTRTVLESLVFYITVKTRLFFMNWPGLGLFKISGTKRAELLGILERRDVWPIVNFRNLVDCKL